MMYNTVSIFPPFYYLYSFPYAEITKSKLSLSLSDNS